MSVWLGKGEPANAQKIELVPGTTCWIKGLSGDVLRNGTCATLVEWVEPRGRWKVQTHTLLKDKFEFIGVKPVNLQAIKEPENCAICLDPRRETRMVCVVEDSQDIVAIERTQEFRGRYHVLQGAFSPIDRVGVEQLRVKELMSRVADEDIEEIIVATNPNLEGEATAALLVKYLKPMGVRVSRIASGLPVGGDLEYADELTLGRALEGRTVLYTGNDAQP